MPLPEQFSAKYPGLTRTQIKLLTSCFELYQERGLHSLTRAGYERALCSICPSRAGCWPGDTAKTEHGHNDGVISLPHVGRRYTADGSGVVVLGLNFYDYAGLEANISLVAWEADAFRDREVTVATYDNQDGYRGSKFAYRTTASATTLSRALSGVATDAPLSGGEMAATLSQIARLQTVKCSPRHNYSKPNSAMLRNCPPLILADELDVLKPGHVLVFGNDAFWALRRLPGFEMLDWLPNLKRAAIGRDWGTAEVWGLYHPAARNSHLWERSEDALRTATAKWALR